MKPEAHTSPDGVNVGSSQKAQIMALNGLKLQRTLLSSRLTEDCNGFRQN